MQLFRYRSVAQLQDLSQEVDPSTLQLFGPLV